MLFIWLVLLMEIGFIAFTLAEERFYKLEEERVLCLSRSYYAVCDNFNEWRNVVKLHFGSLKS